MNHHAKGSAYESNEVPFDDILDIPSRANFGGQSFWTDKIFLWARDMLERAASSNKHGCRYFNCSNGIRISGMIPCLPRTVSLPIIGGKTDLLNMKIKNFPKYGYKKFQKDWADSKLVDKISYLRETLIKKIDKDSNADSLEFMDDMYKTLDPIDNVQAEHHLFRGTLIVCMSALNYYFSRISSIYLRKRLVESGKKELVKTINHIAEISINLVISLDPEYKKK